MEDDAVFRALADPSRRLLLDRLFERDGRTLGELEAELDMTRFGVMKHLRVLEEAGLVITRRSGRSKLHFLNPVPIRLIHDRWIDKFTVGPASVLAEEQPSRVTWEIEPMDGGYCKLTLTHDRLEGAPKTADSVSGAGWMFVLSGLKTLVETGTPLAGA